MTALEVIDISRQSLWIALKIAGPLLLVALVVGVVVSLFQALTQIQEMTLTFIPKIFSVLLVLFILLPFYGELFDSLVKELFDRMVMVGS